MPSIDPDKNPIRQILEDSADSIFPESDRDVFQSIASYHGVPYFAKNKCECWEGYKRVPGTKPCAPGSCEKCDEGRKSASKLVVADLNNDEEDELLAAFEKETPLTPGAAIDKPELEGHGKLPGSGSENLRKDQLSQGFQVTPLGDDPGTYHVGPAIAPGTTGETERMGGERFVYDNPNFSADGSRAAMRIDNKDVNFTLSGGRLKSVTSVDGITPDQADNLSDEQIAALAILAHRGEASGIGIGSFNSIVNARAADPAFKESLDIAVKRGPAASRSVTVHDETKADAGPRNREEEMALLGDNPEEAFMRREFEIERKRNLQSLAEDPEGDVSDDLRSFAEESYEQWKERVDRVKEQLSNGERPEDQQDRQAFQMYLNLLREFKGIPVEGGGETGSRPAVPEARGVSAASKDKKDTPSPKAAEAVFQALDDGDHEAAHELMGHTDCPMECTTQNEGVCKHGYMSAGRTRVIFLDKDLRRASVRVADFWDTIKTPLENAFSLTPGGQAVQGLGNLVGINQPFTDAMEVGAQGIKGISDSLDFLQDSPEDLGEWNPATKQFQQDQQHQQELNELAEQNRKEQEQRDQINQSLRFPNQ